VVLGILGMLCAAANGVDDVKVEDWVRALFQYIDEGLNLPQGVGCWTLTVVGERGYQRSGVSCFFAVQACWVILRQGCRKKVLCSVALGVPRCDLLGLDLHNVQGQGAGHAVTRLSSQTNSLCVWCWQRTW